MRRAWLLLIDVVALALCTIMALLLRDNLELSAHRFQALLPYLAASLGIGAVVFASLGLNRTIWRFSGLRDYVDVGIAVAATVLLAVGAGFAYNRMEDVARTLPLLQGVLATAVLIALRVLARLRRTWRAQGRWPGAAAPVGGEAVLLVGLNATTELYLRCAADMGGNELRVVGILGRNKRHSGRLVLQRPVLGTPEDLRAILGTLSVHGVHVSRIVVTPRPEELSPVALMQLREAEEQGGIVIDMLSERLGIAGRPAVSQVLAAATARAADGQRLLSLVAAQARVALRRPYWRIRRLLDVVAALLGLVVLFPLIVVVWVLVLIDVGFPAIFWQERLGRFGRPFRLYKFRSMSAAYDRHGERRLEGARTSLIGGFLRRSRLDELPQLYNVLRGQMSVIGPRPLLRVDQPADNAVRLMVRPGLTGWAQVNGGRLLSIEEKAALDHWYVCNASAAVDLEILWRTLGLLARGEHYDPVPIERAWLELRRVGGGEQQASDAALTGAVGPERAA